MLVVTLETGPENFWSETVRLKTSTYTIPNQVITKVLFLKSDILLFCVETGENVSSLFI
jgi:hypothetical protein